MESNLITSIKKEKGADNDTNENSSISIFPNEESSRNEFQSVVMADVVKTEFVSIPSIKKEKISRNDIVEERCEKLSSIFPDVDKKYIQNLCSNPSLDENEGDILGLLVDHLLSHKIRIESDSSESISSETSEDIKINTRSSNDSSASPSVARSTPIIAEKFVFEDSMKQKVYDDLLSIFPNIDHTIIQKLCSNFPFKEKEGNVVGLLTNHLLRYQNHIDRIHLSNDVSNSVSKTEEVNKLSKCSARLNSIATESHVEPCVKKEIVSDNEFGVDHTMNDKAAEETQMRITQMSHVMPCEAANTAGSVEIVDRAISPIEETSSLISTIKKERVNEDTVIKDRYSKLSSIFPDIDHDYLQRISANPPFDNVEGDLLSMLIDYLLNYRNQSTQQPLEISMKREYHMPNVVEETLSSSSTVVHAEDDTVNDQLLSEILFKEELAEQENERLLNEKLLSEFLQKEDKIVDEKMKMLVDILPDACPETLRNFVEQNRDSSDSLQQLVDNFLSSKNYEKRDQYFAKLKMQKNIEQCITDFNVEEFLKKYPEPFDYFEDSNRSNASSEKAISFLCNKYRYYNTDYVKEIYAMNKNNLSLADKALRRENVPDTLAHSDLNQIDDTLLLQEIAFIQNRTLLKEYLDNLHEAEQNELEILRVQELLLECQCCFDECKPLDTIECDNNHVFCKKCVIKGTLFATSNQQMSIKCFAGCNNEFSLRVLQKILPNHVFEAFFKKRQEQEVMDAKLDGLENCPCCLYTMELAPEIKIFTCNNPECMKITCRMCKKPNHLPIKCEDVLDEDQARIKIEEAMSKALIRRCYKCQRPFVKSVGCNTMTCRCGATMCYICQQPFSRQYSHRGCGRESRQFEQEQVELNRRRTTAEIQQDFPDLKIPKIQ
ncbi:hypothetical protein QAD02_014709 [Eretmocerus hayati]|uniref:Uncharacterized protein n=1 Tax=Eretmocerus hayati TaxID=131215 RepID=A0ACC2P6H2_9HYME|nr:hypothetical protein QAD02_014709 [Eretmocerus hayati]